MTDAELRALAEKATPGPREYYHIGPERCIHGCEVDAGNFILPKEHGTGGEPIFEAKDAAFIAACDPTTVLGLLDRLRAAETALANGLSTFDFTKEGA